MSLPASWGDVSLSILAYAYGFTKMIFASYPTLQNSPLCRGVAQRLCITYVLLKLSNRA